MNEEGPKSREAVDILTRVAKSVSYTIDRGVLRVADFILAKTAYRLGEGISGVVEINQSIYGWAAALKILIQLEALETLPEFLLDKSRRNNNHNHYNLRTVSTHSTSDCRRASRIAFTLDIPSDDTPGFEVHDSSRPDAPKALEWQIRVSMLVGIPSHSGRGKQTRQRSLIRDGVPSEWDYTYTSTGIFAPLTKQPTAKHTDPSSGKNSGGWLSYFIPSVLSVGTGSNDLEFLGGSQNATGGSAARQPYPEKESIQELGERDQDRLGLEKNWKGKGREGIVEPDGLGEESEWRDMPLETIECVIPVKVWPGNTAFRPNEIEFRL